MVLSNTLNHFLNQNCLTDTGSTEETDFSPQHVRGQQVDDLDAGFEQLSLRLQLVEGRRCAVNAPPLNTFKFVVGVQHFAKDVEHLAFGDISHGNRDRTTSVADFLATDHTIGGLQGDRANEVVAEVLGNLQCQGAGLAANGDRRLQGVVHRGEGIVRKLNVNHRTGNAGNTAGGCCLLRGALAHIVFLFLYFAETRASAPPTISEICWVISACRALFDRVVYF